MKSVLNTFFLCSFSLPHHLYQYHHLSPQICLFTPPFVDTESTRKKKCLYLREPLFQFLGLCTIVENQKKKKVISIKNKTIVLHQRSNVIF